MDERLALRTTSDAVDHRPERREGRPERSRRCNGGPSGAKDERSVGGFAGVRLGFRFLGAMLVGDIPISFIQGREDAEKTTGTVSQCYLSHRDAG